MTSEGSTFSPLWINDEIEVWAIIMMSPEVTPWPDTSPMLNQTLPSAPSLTSK